MNKVTCLKRILSKLSAKNADDYNCSTVCECLHELAKEVPTIGKEVVGLQMNFARKLTTDGKFLLGYEGNINAFLKLKNGELIPVEIAFTDVE